MPNERNVREDGDVQQPDVQADEKQNEVVETKVVPRKLYNRQAGIRGRDGGPYLDEVEANERERIAALHEERDFDPEKAKARLGGNLLAPAEFLEDNVYSNPGSRALVNPATIALDDADAPGHVTTARYGVADTVHKEFDENMKYSDEGAPLGGPARSDQIPGSDDQKAATGKTTQGKVDTPDDVPTTNVSTPGDQSNHPAKNVSNEDTGGDSRTGAKRQSVKDKYAPDKDKK